MLGWQSTGTAAFAAICIGSDGAQRGQTQGRDNESNTLMEAVHKMGAGHMHSRSNNLLLKGGIGYNNEAL